MPVGQVILGVRDLDATSATIETLGRRVIDGGVHPGLGTANRLVPLGNAYLELLGVIASPDAAQLATWTQGNGDLPSAASE